MAEILGVDVRRVFDAEAVGVDCISCWLFDMEAVDVLGNLSFRRLVESVSEVEVVLGATGTTRLDDTDFAAVSVDVLVAIAGCGGPGEAVAG